MDLNYPWVYEELAKPENNTYLTDELIVIQMQCFLLAEADYQMYRVFTSVFGQRIFDWSTTEEAFLIPGIHIDRKVWQRCLIIVDHLVLTDEQKAALKALADKLI